MGSRGLTAGVTRRDGFIASSTRTSINDTFDTERVEVLKGANALLYGASGAGGFANTQSIGHPLYRFVFTNTVDITEGGSVA